jgi:hypothetical protein
MGLMDKIRKGVAEVAEEAEKAARIGRLKTEISGFAEEKKKLCHEIGERVVEVYASGGSTNPDFSTEWERIKGLDAEIAEREIQIEETRAGEPEVQVETDEASE